MKQNTNLSLEVDKIQMLHICTHDQEITIKEMCGDSVSINGINMDTLMGAISCFVHNLRFQKSNIYVASLLTDLRDKIDGTLSDWEIPTSSDCHE
jgi:hypothetical protein